MRGTISVHDRPRLHDATGDLPFDALAHEDLSSLRATVGTGRAQNSAAKRRVVRRLCFSLATAASCGACSRPGGHGATGALRICSGRRCPRWTPADRGACPDPHPPRPAMLPNCCQDVAARRRQPQELRVFRDIGASAVRRKLAIRTRRALWSVHSITRTSKNWARAFKIRLDSSPTLAPSRRTRPAGRLLRRRADRA
jgi:hypothetical protein